MRAGDLGADGRRIAVAHGAKTGGGQEAAGVMEIVELSGPHLVLTDPRGNDGLAFGQAAELLNDLLGHDASRNGGVREGIFFSPTLNLFAPLGPSFGKVGVGTAGEKLVQAFEGEADIGQDGQSDDLVLVEFGGIDIDVNDGGSFGELGNFSRNAVIEANAEGKQEIALVDGVVGVDGAMHPEPLEGLGVGFGKAADPHQGGGDRDSGGAGEFEEIRLGARGDDSAPDVEHGSLSFFDQAKNFVQGDFIGGGGWMKAGNIHDGGPSDLGGGFLHVLGDIDDHRAWATGGGDMKGLGHDAGDITRMHDEVAVFDDGEGNAEDIGLLESAPADGSGGNLSRDGDHGNGVHKGIGDSRDQVGRSGAGGGHDDADLAGGTSIALGHEGATLFVTGENGANLFGAGEGLVKHHAGPAGVGEDGINASVFESLDQEIATHGRGRQLGSTLGGLLRRGLSFHLAHMV